MPNSSNHITYHFSPSEPHAVRIIKAQRDKLAFAQESFQLQGIFIDINERDTSSLDYKHKHMVVVQWSST